MFSHSTGFTVTGAWLCTLAVAISNCFVSVCHTAAADNAWQIVNAPEIWKKPPAGKLGYAWYRCAIEIPAEWRGRDFELFVEPVDDAREFYVNGRKVGTAGAFPPEFRSGLGDPDRYRVDSGALSFGQPNVLAIRVFDSDGRGGFNVAAPVLFASSDGIRLEGSWQFRAGDNPEWVKLYDELKSVGAATFSKIQSAAEISKILRRLPGEDGPLSPDQALKKFRTSAGLAVEIALADPHIGQPLSIKFDERGRLWVAEYLQYPNPAGLKMVSRDKFLRSVYDKTPLPPPNHFPGADKISIHEDTDFDGKYDKHAVFVSGLSLATSFEFDRDGVWVLNPPYLLFYPDRNHDDLPDGDPQVHLEGFGLEDSHSVTNNLRWGPDGWLYASQGSTVTGNIRRYGSKDKPIHSMGQLIWRYHPPSQRYEIFAEGGGNSFGVEFDAKGRVYSGHNGGDTRGFHYVQGGYYQKGFGKHGALSNPYAYGYFPMMQHHSVPRFTHTFVIYEGGRLGSEYEGKLFGVAPLLSHVVYSRLMPEGSTFKTADIGQALSTNDPWFRPVDIHAGPDGGLYVADMYEQRIDHAAHYQGRIDRESGRIYRLKGTATIPTASFDFSRPAESLLEAFKSDSKWVRQTAQRILAERQDPSTIGLIRSRLLASSGQESLELLWALNRVGGLREDLALNLLDHTDPHVRLWTVRLVCDGNSVSQTLADELSELAKRESYVEVRSQLACSARRLSADQCIRIVSRLFEHDEDVGDPHLPLLLWWALENKVEMDREAVVALFESPAVWRRPIAQKQIIEQLVRRLAQSGRQRDLLACARLLEMAPNADSVKLLMAGFEKAYEGRSLTDLPDQLISIIAKRGGGSLALRLRQADPYAVREALKTIVDEKAKKETRIQLLQVVGQIRLASGIESLLQVIEGSSDPEIRIACLTAMQSFDSPEIGYKLAALSDRLNGELRSVLISLLSSRPAWTAALLADVDTGRIKPSEVPLAVVQRMALHEGASIAQSIQKHWGALKGADNEQLRKKILEVQSQLGSGTGNPYKGKLLYKAQCGKCHTLFEEGGLIGPDLTQYNRDDLSNMLVNIVNPSLQIREGFEAFVIVTSDGLALNGFIADQDNRIVVLRTADGQSIVVPRDEIETMKASPISIMPEGLLNSLEEQQIRDLFAYLRASQPLN